MPTAYDDVAYDDRPVAEAHPARLHAEARSWGVDAVLPETARVLELGCAHGAHLLPLAYRMPKARFLGIDLSPSQIEAGRERVRALGLQNLELRAADVCDLDLPGGSFDYVIAHGLFSWVPPPVQDAILSTCRHVLSKAGVAYVSYNAMPGWGLRGSLRQAMLAWGQDATDERTRVARVRDGLARLAAITPLSGTAEGSVLQQEIEDLRDKPDMYLLHEYLAPACSAFTVGEFVQRAAASNLQYLDDVAPLGLPGDDEPSARASIAALGLDRIGSEHALDCVAYRQFRATLLVRSELELRVHRTPPPTHSPARAPPALSERPAVSALARLEVSTAGYATTAGHAVAEVDPFHGALVRHLDGTRTIPEVVDALIEDVRAGRLQAHGASGTPDIQALRQALPAMVEASIGRLQQVGLFD